jgi:phosphogluconate dehydratase
MSSTHPTVRDVTDRIRERSHGTRSAYPRPRQRPHGLRQRRACLGRLPANDKFKVVAERAPNIGIVTAYNDMLSAHAPYQGYPDVIKDEARRLGATAQVAGGVPAMCDGVTQGTPAWS